VEKTTFSSYTQMVKGKIVPYFRGTDLPLGGLQAKHIQSFYLHELKTVSASTVIHEHANIHKALKYAVKMDLIPFNPADKVERPKKQKYIADYYRLDELEQLFEASKGHPYSLLIQMTAFYGLRRSEALGLKWDAIDFERNTITIRHVVTAVKVDGKYEIVQEDRAKNEVQSPFFAAGHPFPGKTSGTESAAEGKQACLRQLLQLSVRRLSVRGCHGEHISSQLRHGELQQASGAKRSAAHSLPRSQAPVCQAQDKKI
jgi:site-specific recombinase XerC